MVVKSKLAEIQDALAPEFELVCIKGDGSSSFVYALHKGQAVEISEATGGFWLEFWDKGFDQDAGHVQEMSVESAEQAIEKAAWWLRDPCAGCWPDEAEYVAYLEAERRMFAWCLLRLGSYSAEDADREVMVRYPYQPPEARCRGLVFHDLAWDWAVKHLYPGGPLTEPPELDQWREEYERESWKLHGQPKQKSRIGNHS